MSDTKDEIDNGLMKWPGGRLPSSGRGFSAGFFLVFLVLGLEFAVAFFLGAAFLGAALLGAVFLGARLGLGFGLVLLVVSLGDFLATRDEGEGSGDALTLSFTRIGAIVLVSQVVLVKHGSQVFPGELENCS